MHFLVLLIFPALGENDLSCNVFEENDYCSAYGEALSVAMTPTASRIDKSLTPIRYSNPVISILLILEIKLYKLNKQLASFQVALITFRALNS